MKRLLFPLVALLLGGGGFISPVDAKPASPREKIEELRAIRSRMSGQAFKPVPVAEAMAKAPVTASKLGNEITLAEAQAQDPAKQFTPNSSLFGRDNTDVRIEADYQGGPRQNHSKASMTLAPKGKPFLVQVTGEQTTGTCTAGPGGTFEYDSRKVDVYGAYRFWTNTTEGNIGTFVRFQDNKIPTGPGSLPTDCILAPGNRIILRPTSVSVVGSGIVWIQSRPPTPGLVLVENMISSMEVSTSSVKEVLVPVTPRIPGISMSRVG